MKYFFIVFWFLILGACTQKISGVEAAFEQAKKSEIGLRVFLQEMPKGGDIHNHLYGAVYAESWIEWAEKDGLCLDKKALAIRFPANDNCAPLQTVKQALYANQDLRNQLIEKLSMRDYVPYAGWSGHDQFFATFGAMAARPERFGDMVAETANLAGRQNILYLELLHTMELFETILPMTAGINLSGDAKKDYEILMNGEFGKALPEMIERAIKDIDRAMIRKDEILGCKTDKPQPGCNVEIRFLNQPVRTLPSASVYAHQIFGWELMKQDNRFVGTNLVAPEDDFIALKYYDDHMQQIGFLQKNSGKRNVSLHAGELWLGLVEPEELRDHVQKAVHIAKAKRIGHGTDIVFEDNYKELLKYMSDNKIAVEICITSSDTILGVSGDEHPIHIYRKYGVPVILCTDDEGVSRIDLTHEYMRAVQDFDISYSELKQISFNSIKYAFLDEETKQKLLAELTRRFAIFEARYKK